MIPIVQNLIIIENAWPIPSLLVRITNFCSRFFIGCFVLCLTPCTHCTQRKIDAQKGQNVAAILQIFFFSFCSVFLLQARDLHETYFSSPGPALCKDKILDPAPAQT